MKKEKANKKQLELKYDYLKYLSNYESNRIVQNEIHDLTEAIFLLTIGIIIINLMAQMNLTFALIIGIIIVVFIFSKLISDTLKNYKDADKLSKNNKKLKKTYLKLKELNAN